MKKEYIHQTQMAEAQIKRLRARRLRDELEENEELLRKARLDRVNDPAASTAASGKAAHLLLIAAVTIVAGTTYLTTYDTLVRLGWPSLIAATIALAPAIGMALTQKWLGRKHHEAKTKAQPGQRPPRIFLVAGAIAASLDLAFTVPAVIALQFASGLNGLGFAAAFKAVGLALLGCFFCVVVFFQAGETVSAERQNAIAAYEKRAAGLRAEIRSLEASADLLELNAKAAADRMSQDAPDGILYEVWRPTELSSPDTQGHGGTSAGIKGSNGFARYDMPNDFNNHHQPNGDSVK